MPEPRVIPSRRVFVWLLVVVGVALLSAVALFHERLTPGPTIILLVLGGLLTFGGVRQLFRPLPFATLGPTGISFPFCRIKEIPWSRVLDVQIGPKAIRSRRGTEVLLRQPIVLRLIPDPSESTGWTAQPSPVIAPDGNAERLIDTSGCTISTEELIAEIGRWRPAAVARRLGEATNTFTARAAAGPPLNSLIFLLLFGAIFVAVGSFMTHAAYSAHAWPTTTATILSSRIGTSHTHDASSYRPEILYRYRVGDRSYTGNRFAFSYGSSYQAVSAVIRRYPAGATVTAFYDPAKPSQAVLEQSTVLFPLVFVAVGAGVIGLGVFLLQKRAKTSKPALA